MAASCRGLDPPPVKPGSPGRPVPGYRHRRAGCRWRARPGRRAGRHRRAPAAATRHARRRSGTTTSAASRRTSRATRAGISPATAGTSTRTAISSSWAASTTSSTWPAIASRPARWRRSSRPTRTSPSAPCSACPTSCAARCRSASSCSRRAPSATRSEMRDELVALVRERIGPGRLLPRRPRRRAPAEDALRQDPALDDARHRSRPRLRPPRDDRRPGHHRGDRRDARPAGLRARTRARARGARAARSARPRAARPAACARRRGSRPRPRPAGAAQGGAAQPPAWCGRARRTARERLPTAAQSAPVVHEAVRAAGGEVAAAPPGGRRSRRPCPASSARADPRAPRRGRAADRATAVRPPRRLHRRLLVPGARDLLAQVAHRAGARAAGPRPRRARTT